MAAREYYVYGTDEVWYGAVDRTLQGADILPADGRDFFNNVGEIEPSQIAAFSQPAIAHHFVGRQSPDFSVRCIT